MEGVGKRSDGKGEGREGRGGTGRKGRGGMEGNEGVHLTHFASPGVPLDAPAEGQWLATGQYSLSALLTIFTSPKMVAEKNKE